MFNNNQLIKLFGWYFKMLSLKNNNYPKLKNTINLPHNYYVVQVGGTKGKNKWQELFFT